MFEKMHHKLGVKSERTKVITKHIFWSFLYKGGHLASTFLIIPLTINYLETDSYGVWLTITSFVGWFSLFDVGMGNGLRNRFAEAMAKKQFILARAYVSTAYFTVLAISCFLIIISGLVSYFVDWTLIFNSSPQMFDTLKLLMPIVFGCFSLQLVLKLITSIYVANQNHSFQGKVSFIISFSSLLLIWVLTRTSDSSLLLFGFIISFLPLLILLVINLLAFNKSFKDYAPRRKYYKKEYFNDIMGLSVSFFLIQSSLVILFGTDNFIIAQLFKPQDVVPYNIAKKYISISAMILTIIITPYWSGITDAYTKGEFEWIKKSMKNLIGLSFITVLFICFLVIISSWAYNLWLGDTVVVPKRITIYMAVFFSITLIYAPFNYFINGTGKIRIQVITMLFGAILNIPLSIFLVKNLGFGIEGVILATIICVLPNLIFFPIQYFKLIDTRAKGIWNK